MGVRMWKSFAMCWHNRQQFANYSILFSNAFYLKLPVHFVGWFCKLPALVSVLGTWARNGSLPRKLFEWLCLAHHQAEVLESFILPFRNVFCHHSRLFTPPHPTPCSRLSPPHTLWTLLSYRLIVLGLSSHFALSLHFSVSPWVKVWMLVFSQLL